MEKDRLRRVLIVEGNADGHRLSYVALLASAATASGDYVIVATSKDALQSEEWSIHIGISDSVGEVRVLDESSLAAIGRLANELAVDHVVVPDGDAVAYELSKGRRWSGHGTISALVMRENGQPSGLPGSALAKTLVKRTLLQSANLRPRVQVRVLKSATWRGFSLLPVSRDPVNLSGLRQFDEPADPRMLPEGYFWFGVVGNVSPRKNLPLVAASLAALGRPGVALAIAGQIHEGTLQQAKSDLDRINNHKGHVVIINRLLSDSEMDRLIAELDCVVLAHSNEGPSGILGKAVASGTRIIAAGASTLRDDCRHIGVGAEWVKMKKHLLTKAFARAMLTPRPRRSQLASPDEFTSGLLGIKR